MTTVGKNGVDKRVEKLVMAFWIYKSTIDGLPQTKKSADPFVGETVDGLSELSVRADGDSQVCIVVNCLKFRSVHRGITVGCGFTIEY